MIFQKFPAGPLSTNAIVLGCNQTKKIVVIDPAQGTTPLILDEIERYGLHLEKILLTHSHWDHIADVHLLKMKSGAPVFVHPLDAPNLEHPGSDRVPMAFPIHGEKPDGFLEEGRTIELGTVEIEVIHTPGHSPGSVCFYIPKHKILISGDTLFKGSIGTLYVPTAEPQKMWHSLKKLEKLPPDTHVVPGHGPDTTIAAESWLSRAQEIFSD